MDPNALAGMVFALILTAMVGGFILLIPLSRRLGQLIDVWMQERRAAPGQDEVAELTRTIRLLEKEVERIGERQQFTERLLESRQAERTIEGSSSPD